MVVVSQSVSKVTKTIDFGLSTDCLYGTVFSYLSL